MDWKSYSLEAGTEGYWNSSGKRLSQRSGDGEKQTDSKRYIGGRTTGLGKQFDWGLRFGRKIKERKESSQIQDF